MKKNEIVDLKTKTVDELSRLLLDFQNEVEKMSIEKATGALKNTNAIRNKKKDIARVLTFLSMKAASVPLSETTASQREVNKNE